MRSTCVIYGRNMSRRCFSDRKTPRFFLHLYMKKPHQASTFPQIKWEKNIIGTFFPLKKGFGPGELGGFHDSNRKVGVCSGPKALWPAVCTHSHEQWEKEVPRMLHSYATYSVLLAGNLLSLWRVQGRKRQFGYRVERLKNEKKLIWKERSKLKDCRE